MRHIEIDESLLDCPIDELTRRHPELVPFFLASQMDCVGCDFDRFHSLRFALELYDVSIDKFLSKSLHTNHGQDSNDHGGER